MIKIQYASDLHLEFMENSRYLCGNPITPMGDILILAGDTGCLGDVSYTVDPFWDWVSEHFRQVIVCFGNHEFYEYYNLASLVNGTDVPIRPNVHCYYNQVVHIDDVDIIVSTLWSHISLRNAAMIEKCVSDFHRVMYHDHILGWKDFNHEHDRCLQFIKNAVGMSLAAKKIVVTHHVPSFQLLPQEFNENPINNAFAVELTDYIEQSDIDYWIYGHSHRNIDKRIGNTQCVCNQLGYISYGENKNFKNDKLLEI